MLMDFDEDLEGLNRKERDRNINLASPSKVAIELLLLTWLFPDPFVRLSLDVELVRRPAEEIYILTQMKDLRIIHFILNICLSQPIYLLIQY